MYLNVYANVGRGMMLKREGTARALRVVYVNVQGADRDQLDNW